MQHRYSILQSCLSELTSKGIIHPAVNIADDWRPAAAALAQKIGEQSVQAYVDIMLEPSQQMDGADGEQGAGDELAVHMERYCAAFGELPVSQYLYLVAAVTEVCDCEALRLLFP